MKNDHAPGATPLDPDESAGLIPKHIATREQLDEWEAENIVAGMRWASRRRRKTVLHEQFLRELHKHMFDRTWKWAGTYRPTEKNLGVAPHQIAPSVRDLLADVKTQIENKVAPINEIATRFHHRLVTIHPFANGNGRHARLITDLLLQENGSEPFTWGRGDLVHEGEARRLYLEALRAADRRDYRLLLAFVRSQG